MAALCRDAATRTQSETQFRAEFKAQGVKRLRVQVDQNAEELVDASCGHRQGRASRQGDQVGH